MGETARRMASGGLSLCDLAFILFSYLEHLSNRRLGGSTGITLDSLVLTP